MNPAPAALTIAQGLSLPLDFVTQPCGIIARRGAGKTHTGVVLAEELLSAGAQVVVVDPLGVWWGLRSSRDGAGKGFPIVVFGGDHGDLPIAEEMGAQLAEAVVSMHLCAVLDLSALSKSGQRRFVTAFAEALYQAKGPQAHRTPMHVLIDEADMFAPQRVQAGEERMLGAIDTLVRRGRVRGFGVTMITQRPATIHKDCLTQIEVLIALQLTSPQDRKAVDEWVQANASAEQRAQFMGSLASLQRGEAWVWSPSWLQCFRRVQIRQRNTFDSSRTPTAGERPIVPKQLAEVDLTKLQGDMAAALEKARADDPAVLRKRIAALEKQLAGTHFSQEQAEKVAHQAVTQRDMEWRARVARFLAGAANELSLAEVIGPQHQPAVAVSRPAPAPQPRVSVSHAGHGRTGAPAAMPKGERAILIALAQAGRPRTHAWLAIRTGYSGTGGGFRNYLGALRTRGLIEGAGEAIAITDRGLAELGTFDPLPTGDALLAHWLANAGGQCGRRILEAVAAAHPRALPVPTVAQLTGYESEGGGFRNALGRLRTLGLITGRGEVRATDELMGDA